jgi:hypothetical protein
MATAFHGTMSIKNTDGTLSGSYFDSDDVTLHYITFTANAGNTTYVCPKDGYLQDIVLNITSAGTTIYFKIFLNQKDSGIMVTQAACFPTINNRFFLVNPIPIKAGTVISIQTIT